MRYITPVLAVLSLAPALRAHAVSGPANPRPNIIVILADDLGYSDLGCFGGEIRTPHLDALADRGLSFTQFYNGGRCCPTRASLLTGLYPHQAGVGRMTADAGLPGYRGFLTDNTLTIPEVLRASGAPPAACRCRPRASPLVARRNGRWELYDAAKDRAEVNDLAARHPERVREMQALWEQWANRTNVYPSPDAPGQSP